MKFAALGRTRMLYAGIEACVGAGHELALIATAPAAPEYDVVERDFERLAGELACPYFCDTRLDGADRVEQLRQAGADVAISVNWPTVVGAAARASFAHGVLNAHAGDLPRYRGNACPNWAILQGEERVVVTVHVMADELDAGPVLMKRATPLTESTYIGDVYEFLEVAVPEMFAETLTGLEDGSLEPQEQPSDPSLSLRCYPRRPSDGLIDWTQPAELIARLVRASAEPFAGAFSELDGERITIWRARAEALPQPSLGVPGQVIDRRPDTGEVSILTGDGTLVLELVGTDRDSTRAAPADVVRSLRQRLGAERG